MCNGDSLPHLSTYCPVNVCEDVGSVGVGGAVPGVEFDFEVDPEGVAGKPACLGVQPTPFSSWGRRGSWAAWVRFVSTASRVVLNLVLHFTTSASLSAKWG